MAGPEQVSAATLLDELAMLSPQERREVASILRRLSESLSGVREGKTTAHVLGHYRDRYRAMATSMGFEGHMKWAEAMP